MIFFFNPLSNLVAERIFAMPTAVYRIVIGITTGEHNIAEGHDRNNQII